jgi:gamma-glutamyltranspeptidase/glutathione hydrolase
MRHFGERVNVGLALDEKRKATEAFNEWGGPTYYPGGKVPQTGEIFRQPNLAATLRRIVAAETAARKAEEAAAVALDDDDGWTTV